MIKTLLKGIRWIRYRHIKTLIQKYGKCDLSSDIIYYMQQHQSNERYDVYKWCPYIGILYVPVEYTECWYDFETAQIINEDGEMLRMKVVMVSDDKCILLQYDDHHKDIHFNTILPNDYVVVGNVLKRLG